MRRAAHEERHAAQALADGTSHKPAFRSAFSPAHYRAARCVPDDSIARRDRRDEVRLLSSWALRRTVLVVATFPVASVSTLTTVAVVPSCPRAEPLVVLAPPCCSATCVCPPATFPEAVTASPDAAALLPNALFSTACWALAVFLTGSTTAAPAAAAVAPPSTVPLALVVDAVLPSPLSAITTPSAATASISCTRGAVSRRCPSSSTATSETVWACKLGPQPCRAHHDEQHQRHQCPPERR